MTSSRNKTGCDQRKDDFEHILTKLLRADAGDSIDLMIRRACLDFDPRDLSVEPRTRLGQISIIKEDEVITLKFYEAGLARSLKLCIFITQTTKKGHPSDSVQHWQKILTISEQAAHALLSQKCGWHAAVSNSLQGASRATLEKCQTPDDPFRRGSKRVLSLIRQPTGEIDVFKASKSSDDIQISSSSDDTTSSDLSSSTPSLALTHGELDP